MTDTSTVPQPVAAPPDDQFGFSYIELLHLMKVSDSPQARLSRELLHLDEIENEQLLADAGASSLLARGLLRFTDDGLSVVPVDQALYIAYVLTNSTRWTTYQATSGDSGDTGFLIESSLGAALIQPRALDTWWFMLLPPDVPIADLVVDTGTGLAGQAPEMGVFINMRSLHLNRTFTIHRTQVDWSYAYGMTGSEVPDGRHEGSTQDETAAAFRAFVQSFPLPATSEATAQ